MFLGGRCVLHAGVAARGAAPGGAAMGPICMRALETGAGTYLANLVLYPGAHPAQDFQPAVRLRAVGPDVATCTSVQHAKLPRARASQAGLPLRCRHAHRTVCLRETPSAMRLAAPPRQARLRAAQGGRSLSATCRTTRRACWCSQPASARCSSPPPTPCAASAAWTRRARALGGGRQRADVHRHGMLHGLSLETGEEKEGTELKPVRTVAFTMHGEQHYEDPCR